MPDLQTQAIAQALFGVNPANEPDDSGAELRILCIDGPPIKRILTMLTLRARVRIDEYRLRRSGRGHVRAFAVTPDLTRPFCISEMRTPAAAYARQNLRLGAAGDATVLRRFVEWIMGCDPSVGAVVLVGTRR